MAAFNKVVLVGNLTRDPELRYTTKGTACGKLGLAVNRTWVTDTNERKEEVTFVDVEVYGRTAENSAKFLAKGRPALVEGRLRLDQWTDKESGQPRQRLVVVGEQVQFLGAPAAQEFREVKVESGNREPAVEAGPKSDHVPF